MVKALHRAGEVNLDVVFNHTAAGDEREPTICFKSLQNDADYILEPDRTHYANDRGRGSTLTGIHTVVRRMIVDSLRYWVEVMHIRSSRFSQSRSTAFSSRISVLDNCPMGAPTRRPGKVMMR